MIDSLIHFLPFVQQSRIGDDLGLRNGKGWQSFGVLTLHRPSNVDSTEKLAEIIGAIDTIARQVPIVFPVQPRTQQMLAQSGIKHHAQLRLISSLGYLQFLCLLSKATLTLTDSGGIQEETTALGVPCLTLRENTERPVTVSCGTNVLVGTNPSKIVAAGEQILGPRVRSRADIAQETGRSSTSRVS
jgi:UDP-N-acetylglucosamine 2-epimerase (non-hydrolysing)